MDASQGIVLCFVVNIGIYKY